jgi:regulator of sigma E protease
VDPFALIGAFGGLAWVIVAFVAALSIIIAVHEYGHYIVGRWSGIKADVFSLGFGPVLFQRTDRHGTRWQVAALPLGGYVKFRGDANAASAPAEGALEGLSETDRRATMQGAPLWARAATVAAGPVFNFILAALIFAGVIMWQGVATDRVTVGSIVPQPEVGAPLLPGDVIDSLGGTPTPDYDSFVEAADSAPLTPTVAWGITRDGTRRTVDAAHPLPPIAASITPLSAAAEAGMQDGDWITAIDGTPVVSFNQLPDIVNGGNGAPVALTVWRDGQTLTLTVTPRRTDIPRAEGGFETRWLLGLGSGLGFIPETYTPNPAEALWLGTQRVWDTAALSVSGLYHIVTGAISTCNLRGPIGIAETSGAAAAAGFATFILFIAALSVAVGVMNLFPVPVLDGGHLVFHAYEAVTGRPPNERAMRVLMAGGFALIMGLMVFALTNDVVCP